MRTRWLAIVASALIFVSGSSYAQSAVTATCKDGTSFSGASRRGACARHGGVQAFGGPDGTAPAAGGVPAGNGLAANPLAPTTPATQAGPVTTASPAPPQPYTRTAPSALNGAGGQVWVNSASKVYHCQGDRYYGKTKTGSYMAEAAAKAEGDRPSRGKACS